MKIHKEKKNNKRLGELYYYIGKQATNFRICHNYYRDGKKKFSRWINYLDATPEEISKATHRTLLKNEIVLDFDPEKGETKRDVLRKVKKTCILLKSDKINYEVYDTGSRGYHLHIFYKKMFFMNFEKRRKTRTNMAAWFGAELQKNSENVTIALEGVPHWKTGKKKKKVNL